MAVYWSLEFTVLVLIGSEPVQRQEATIAEAVLSFVDGLIIGLLSFEHSRSLRSSALLNSYLFFTLLFDAVQCRTLWLIAQDSASTRLFTTALGAKVVIFLLEAQGKSIGMRSNDRQRCPEETAGILNLSVFFWLNDLFGQGSCKVLTLDDMYPLDESMAAENLEIKF